MKKNFLILLLITTASLFAQKEQLDFLDNRLRKGDYNALKKMAKYFDSKVEITEFLGYHIINTNESKVAKRRILENTMFLNSEIIINSTTTSTDFNVFLKENKKKIKFSTKDYKWDESINAFRNKKLKVKAVDYEKQLFEMLSSENDSIAQSAYINLTKLNKKRIIELSDQYRKADISKNNVLPLFSYRFLKQLVQLTEYSKKNNIDFAGSNKLKNKIELLKSNLSFRERKQLEDNLINTLTLDNITAFEYWSLIYEKSSSLTYSAGRILDKFYSKNWSKLINNQNYLETYLLKSRLFDDLGIIGYCNNYLVKFNGATELDIIVLENFNTKNQKVLKQLILAKELAKKQLVFEEEKKKSWSGNTFDRVENFEKSFDSLMKLSDSSDIFENEISLFLSKIKYSQIEKALNTVDTLQIKDFTKYSFLNRDFGFSFIGNFEHPNVREEFLANYKTLNELNLYTYYIKNNDIDIIDEKGNLDFDKIYEVLKYDINNSFAGGGGSTKDNGVYAVIKILEITFNDTLGYPDKLCSSDGMYGCNSRRRAKTWMNYLKVNNHLKIKHNEPVSFAYE